MRVGIIDDDLEFINIFKEQLYPKLIKMSSDEENQLFSSDEMLPNEVLNNLDVVFFDIQLKDKNSINLISEAKAYFDTKIVFLSSKTNLVFDALKVKPLTFIRKNNLNEDFDMFLALFKNEIVKKRTLKLMYNGRLEKVMIDRIQYISACGHDVTINTFEKEYRLISSLKKVSAEINDKRFVQIQKSVYINMKFIEELKKKSVVMKTGNEIAVSRFFKQNLNEKYLDYLLNEHV